ncbi:helix-turn-helix domain-containing protein [Halobium salinum]|uniref:Helix-turn-helix domain-containing protein n=1 Tax=Halobium salinum TaxID=1364940 RepID=A0ABD5PFX0_9EURY|nr:helix-turn-helix domain-containing protein [Halobium salinum]
MYEATFRIASDGAYAAATAGTDARIELWCNDHCDLLHVTGGDEAAEDAVLAAVRERVGVRDRLRGGDELVVVTDDCLREHETGTVEAYLDRHGPLLLPPLRYARGAKVCRLLALDPASLTACYRDLVTDGFSVDVESKREVGSVAQDGPLLTLDEVLPRLTGRQHETLTTAVEQGYYEIPRRTTTEKVAAAVGVERRTAEEHLRRAENKLIAALMPYLRG